MNIIISKFSYNFKQFTKISSANCDKYTLTFCKKVYYFLIRKKIKYCLFVKSYIHLSNPNNY